MTSSTTSPVKIHFVRNLFLLGKFKSYFEASDLKSKFNYSLIFSTLASNYLLFTEVRNINLYDYLKESPDFFLKETDNPSTNDMADMHILNTYLKEENPEYSFLYYMLTLFILMQALVFFADQKELGVLNMESLRETSLEDIYLYFCEHSNVDYFNSFSYDRYFFFPLTCENMQEITQRLITNHPSLDQLLGLLKSYEL